MNRFKLNSNTLHIEDTDQIFKPISIDFNQMDHDWQYKGIGKNFDLCKAVGLKTLKHPKILDATAGLGADSFILAKMGCDVLMLERNPELASMLESALENFQSQTLKPFFKFQNIDALSYLASCEKFDVIYLDPMFPENQNTALVKKEMQVLQEIVGDDHDSDQLLQLALNKAKNRVVVKRHKGSDFLADKSPTHSIKGKSVRYDVYLI